MSRPCHNGQDKIIIIGKYLNGRARHVEELAPFGMDDGTIGAYSDSDWAGCIRTHQRRGPLHRGVYDQTLVSTPEGHCAIVRRSTAVSRALCEAKALTSLGEEWREPWHPRRHRRRR